ncbi:heme peroxidase [Cucurbitaria berberidis CBS 394.84]|uniref:Heme peroxidase n=1 Tax=Cucurbitaria berberidis CBS 394.84 TaxID=1168544 RepID=A0A9P4GUN5_9PLEO|nr:heme peroxidase [Cucurbitaria berberidis CBS 394.84]KAF1851680.1 heme peroxidase [Cucurbitaria berberidis CBS 394.84]
MAADAKAAWDTHVDTRTGATPPKPAEPSELSKLRNTLGGPFKSLAGLVGAAASPVPDQTGDGSKITPEEKASLYKKIEDGLKDMSYLRIENIQTLLETQREKLMGAYTDDKTYLMEGLIRTAAALPDGSKTRDAVTHKFLEQLWNDLPHPPQSYLGAKYQYRSADGSNNSLVNPQVGAAGTPYARTVKPSSMQTPARPDPGVVFDSIMTRKHAEHHPNKISSMLFYVASIIIHDCFRTSHEDFSVSMTSSYLDLSPLYGSNQAEQDQMRTHVDGKIKPDCFSEARLLFFPPGVGALLIMFNRFHNYTVENLATINEQGRFTKPPAEAPKATGDETADQKAKEKYEAAWKKYDNDLFQTGRLITCGLYVNIILIDYVRTILDLNRTDSNWQLDPRLDIDGVPMGVGNQVSAEFNLVYRWHSSVSDRDEKWTKEMWEGLFGEGRDPKTVGKYEFLAGLNEVYKKTDADPSKRKFAGLERKKDGTLPDQELVDILTSSIEDCANSFGPNRVPSIFRAIEVLGIEQARAWNLGSLNEFRKYFHLEPHNTFADITSDKYVQEQLKHLYDHPDKVEIYPGIVVEDGKKPLAPGSGLCPSYTVSRAVLSDAVALVRGDRFYTHDYNPRTLTNWGYRLVDSDNDVDNGCVFYKLFLRAFPQHFKYNSVYVHYPLTVPSAMEVALKDLKKDHLYDFAKPKATVHPHLVSEYKLATEIMQDQGTFKVVWGKAMEYIMGDAAKDFMLAGDGPKNTASRQMVSKALYISDWDKEVRSYYTAKTRELLQEKSAKIADFNQVDIIRDVGNLAHVHFCAELFMLPLKTDASPHGIFTESELYLIMSGVFALIFFDVDPAGSFPLHVKAHKATHILGSIIETNVQAIASSGFLSSVMQAIWPHDSVLKSYGKHMIQRLLQSGMDPKQLVWGHLLGTAGGMVSNQGQLFSQTLEYFLLGDGKQHWSAIQALAHDDSDAAFEKLMHYTMEGGRLNGETGVVRAVAKETSITEAGKTTHLSAGDAVFVNLRAASHDPAIFPDPDQVDITRPLDVYVHLGHGPHQCLGLPMTRISLTTMLKEVAKLKNLRPALGPQGKVHKVAKAMVADEKYPYHAYLTENWDMYFPFPCALKVVWDD